MPEYRNAGIGTQLIGDLLVEGARTGLPVTIHVESFNPARRLYARLDFELAEDEGVYCLMKWSPEAGRHA